MKTILKLKRAFVISSACLFWCDGLFAATLSARKESLQVSSYLAVAMGHQAQQKIVLSRRKSKNSDVFVVSYVNDDRAFERAVPRSLYAQTMRNFDQIETDLVVTGSLVDAACTTPVEVTRKNKTHIFCRDLVGRKNLKAIDKWFLENKDLALGDLENFK